MSSVSLASVDREITQKLHSVQEQLAAARKELGAEDIVNMVVYCDGGCNNGASEDDRVGYAGLHGYIATAGEHTQISTYTTTARGYFKTSEFSGISTRRTVSSFSTAVNGARKTVASVGLRQIVDFDLGCLMDKNFNGFANTNNRAEIMGLLLTLKLTVPLVKAGIVNAVHVRLDSTYTLSGITQWICNWKKHKYTSQGKPIANADMWEAIGEYYQMIVDGNLAFSFEWVRGHSDNFGNIRADKNCTEAKLYPLDNFIQFKIGEEREQSLPTEEASPKEKLQLMEVPPMLKAYPRIYYYTEKKEERQLPKRFYYSGRHGEKNNDVEFGYMMGQVVHSVTYCDRCEPLELLMDEFDHNSVSRWDEQDIYIIDSTLLFAKEMVKDITVNGLAYVDISSTELKSGEKVLASKKYPVVSGYNALDQLLFLKNLLVRYLKDDLPPLVCETDITKYFYGEKEKGKKGEKVPYVLPLDTKLIKLKAKHRYTVEGETQEHFVSLSRNLDWPLRGPFNGSVNKEPKVSLLTWHDGARSFRYAMVLKDNTGDASIWCASYSNLRILTDKEMKK